MQQATLSKFSPPSAGADGPRAVGQNGFVINLCSSTTPVSLARPDHAGLNRFTFFVSRRLEEGRERFRLHMGYFESQQEAEQLLDIVREIYPGAWAGMAPGQRLRANAGAAAQAAAPAAPAPAPVAAPTPAIAKTAERAAAPVAEPKKARPAVTAAVVAPVVAVKSPRTEPSSNAATGAFSLSNVRAAIAALEDSGVRAPVLQPIPELKPVPVVRAAKIAPSSAAVAPPEPAAPPATPRALAAVVKKAPAAPTAAARPSRPAPVAAPRSVPTQAAEPSDELTDSATLRVLEGGTVSGEAPRQEPCFAVQLCWSVQPIDLTQLPQLAIFSAYTLYGAEGNREGRRWYGLRLGFFTDAVSAKQVAQYVRSEFSSVSVVPVTLRERERAKLAVTRPSPETTAAGKADAVPLAKAKLPPSMEFKFIDDRPAAPKQSPKAAEERSASKPGATRASRGAPGKRVKVRVPGQINGHARAKPMTLEETLEILGAGELKVDDGSETSIEDSGVRHLRLESVKSKPSRLSRLFERLAERIST
jgi:hypothetical protein